MINEIAGINIGKINNIKIASLKGILKKVREYPARVQTIKDRIIVPNVTIPLL